MFLRGANSDGIKVIVFDLDGVMVFPWGFAGYLEKEHKITGAHTAEFFVGPFVRCMRGEADVKAELIPFLPQWNWTGSVDDFLEKWLESENLADTQMVGLVEDLRKNGWLCGLGTNQEANRANYVRKIMCFESLFDYLFFSCELRSIKPEREFFDKARSILGCDADAILFVDNEQPYVEAARAAGWNALLFTSFENLLDERLDFYFAAH